MDVAALWTGLGEPLLRLCFFISLGLFIGNLIEAMNWTRYVAVLVSPLVRLGHLRAISGASFSMAFFSGVTANTMLSEAYEQENINFKELVLSNLFNSLPTLFLHLPTTFFIMVPLIGWAAMHYLGVVIVSSFLRIIIVLILARALLPKHDECLTCDLPEGEKLSFPDVLKKTWKRYVKRIRHILLYTVPIYSLMYILNKYGVFSGMENWMADHVSFLAWMHPDTISIIVLQIAAEFSAGLAAAGALLDAGTIGITEVVLALLVGNVLSSPMRALRHQFPYYAGIFKPGLGLKLIVFNQSLRTVSIILVAAAYALFLG